MKIVLQNFNRFATNKSVANPLQTRIWDRFTTDFDYHFFPYNIFTMASNPLRTLQLVCNRFATATLQILCNFAMDL